jgi:hypothetical protein
MVQNFKRLRDAQRKAETKGQRKLIYILHAIMGGYISMDSVDRADIDDVSWLKLKLIVKKLGA